MNAQLLQLMGMLKQGAAPAIQAGKGLLSGAGGIVGQGARGLRDVAGPALTGVSKFARANPMAAGGIGIGTAAGAGGLGLAGLLKLLQGERQEGLDISSLEGMDEGQIMELLKPLMGRDGGKIY
jgi:hypothetical protein